MTSNAWVYPVYNVVALLGVWLAVYVMQKTEHDRINRVDPVLVQWFRRLAFIGIALGLCYSILNNDWNRSVPILLLVAAGVANLGVNAVALHMRAPPSNGLRHPVSAGVGAIRKIRSIAYHFFKIR